jgi:hypothetical protein
VSNLSSKGVEGVRRGMTGRGYALVDTPMLFDDGLLLRLRRARTTFHADDKRWSRYPRLARYACWLETLLTEALPEEAVSLTELEFRHEPAGSVDQQVDRLHADGSYLRSVVTLYGPTTIYRDEGVERRVPDGHTLLLTAIGRARAVGRPCTLHRRPGAGPQRALIVCSFEPSSEQPPRASVYREVAQADNWRRKPCGGRS